MAEALAALGLIIITVIGIGIPVTVAITRRPLGQRNAELERENTDPARLVCRLYDRALKGRDVDEELAEAEPA